MVLGCVLLDTEDVVISNCGGICILPQHDEIVYHITNDKAFEKMHCQELIQAYAFLKLALPQ